MPTLRYSAYGSSLCPANPPCEYHKLPFNALLYDRREGIGVTYSSFWPTLHRLLIIKLFLHRDSALKRRLGC